LCVRTASVVSGTSRSLMWGRRVLLLRRHRPEQLRPVPRVGRAAVGAVRHQRLRRRHVHQRQPVHRLHFHPSVTRRRGGRLPGPLRRSSCIAAGRSSRSSAGCGWSRVSAAAYGGHCRFCGSAAFYLLRSLGGRRRDNTPALARRARFLRLSVTFSTSMQTHKIPRCDLAAVRRKHYGLAQREETTLTRRIPVVLLSSAVIAVSACGSVLFASQNSSLPKIFSTAPMITSTAVQVTTKSNVSTQSQIHTSPVTLYGCRRRRKYRRSVTPSVTRSADDE